MQQQQPNTDKQQNQRPKKSPRKTPPAAHRQVKIMVPAAADFASPKLSFSSPNAAEVPLPPTHWFSGCSREMLSCESSISAQLKMMLNVV